jgi:ribonuclease J
MLKVHTVGGYNEVGKNMTAVEVDDDVFIFDAGLYLPAIVGVEERERVPTERGMRSLGALPDDLVLDRKDLRKKVRALFVSHAHLDHVGGIQYLAHRYDAPVLATPFTIEVLKTLLSDNKHHDFKTPLVPVKLNDSYNIKGASRTYKVEFINVTHSTIQSAIVVLHTPYGAILYANDFKFDNTPVYGDPPNYKRFKELARSGVKALIVDCLYAGDDRKTPSEKIAKNMLEDVFFNNDNKKSGMIITTFSSHIARLKTIAECGKKLNREVVFMGRSLSKYVSAASAVGRAPFRSSINVLTYRKQVDRMLKKINKNKAHYLVVCTGHQGEPGSILDRIAKRELHYDLSDNDQIIFSSKTIPAPVNELNRAQLEKRLKKNKVRIFDNIHVSGHGGREDLRDLIKVTNPQHVIPSHGDYPKLKAGFDVAVGMGYKKDVNVHIMVNGQELALT